MKYKKSLYNSLIEEFDGGVLVFNTITAAILWIPNEMWEIQEYCGEPVGEWKTAIECGIWVEYTRDEFMELSDCLHDSARQPPDDIVITIAPTYACNMKCEYCFQHERCEPMMSKEIANIVLKSAIQIISKYKAAHITWFGGEPLLAIGVIEYLSKGLIDFCSLHNISYTADIITNGTLLNQENARRLHNCKVTNIQITLDGITHDNVRKMKDGSSSYETIVKNIVQNADDFILVVRSNVSENNVDGIKEMIDDLMVHHALAHKIYFSYYPVSNFEGKTSKGCNYRPFCNLNSYSVHLVGLIEHILKYQSLESITNMFLRPSTIPCEVISKDTVCFDAYGDVYKCGLAMQNTDMKIGNILDNSITDILNNGDQNGWLSFQWDDECKSCNFLPMCHSGCIYRKRASEKNRICSIDRTTHHELVKLMYQYFREQNI